VKTVLMLLPVLCHSTNYKSETAVTTFTFSEPAVFSETTPGCAVSRKKSCQKGDIFKGRPQI